MRGRNVWMALTLMAWFAGSAAADKTTDDLQTGYDKEAGACAQQAGGVTKVVDGATRLQATLSGPEHDALDADLAKLAKGKTTIDAYCADLAEVLELLRANPGAKYKALEHQLDDLDNKIRRARADAKKAIAELEPVIHALVPRMNALAAPAQPDPDKHAPSKFPSGRSAVLPVLAGQWRMSGTPTSDTADYTEGKLAASVWTKAFDGATCDQEKRLAAGGEVADAAGVAWIAHSAAAAKGEPIRAFACLAGAGGSGGWMGYVTIAPGDAATPALRDAMDALMLRMLAARKS